MKPSQERLKELFSYDPETGIFTNRISRGRACAGSVAGSETDHGYIRIIVDGQKCYAHHLAWLYVYGEFPDRIDHVNGNRNENKIANLRKATHAQNCQNSARRLGVSGLRGAYFDPRSRKWFSKIQVGKDTKWLGTFDSAELAAEAYRKAADELFGDFAEHNRLNHERNVA